MIWYSWKRADASSVLLPKRSVIFSSSNCSRCTQCESVVLGRLERSRGVQVGACRCSIFFHHHHHGCLVSSAQRVDDDDLYIPLTTSSVIRRFESAVMGLWDCVRGLVRKLHRLQLLDRDGGACEKKRLLTHLRRVSKQRVNEEAIWTDRNCAVVSTLG